MARRTRVVTRRNHLHGRDIQNRCEDDDRRRGIAARSLLFSSNLEGNVRRAIDFREGEKINANALKTLIRAAVDLNRSKARNKR